MSAPSHSLHLTVKILLVGDSGVGKSSLLLRYCNADVPLTQFKLQPTVGLDFKRKTLMVPLKRGPEALVTLQIWDTAGLERFRAVTTSYYHGAMGVVITYDITDEVSFTNVKYTRESFLYFLYITSAFYHIRLPADPGLSR